MPKPDRGRGESLANQTLGKYELIREIGHGNMATVYLGRDTFHDRDVALKVAHPEHETDGKKARLQRKLFFNEAKAAGLLMHPNIVSVYDAGVEASIRYIVMEYVSGRRTLHPYCRPKNLLPLGTVVDVVLKCAAAFDYAHRKGVVHRDIKPKNILLTEEMDVKISDFGVALITQTDVADTQVQGYVGSPLYMSPEQIRGEQVTNQSDLFALGVVLYELLTGRHPFSADTVPAVTHKITHEPHVPLRDLRPDAPRVLDRVIDRTLKKHPAGRYGMGLDLVGDLGLLVDDFAIPDEDLSSREKFEKVRGLRFFEPFNEAEIWEILNASSWQELDPGEEIIRQGEVIDSFYVIVSGQVAILRERKRVDSLTAGEYFGEIGPADRREGIWSAVAKGPVTAMKVGIKHAGNTSANCQLNLHKAFLATMTERLARSAKIIADEGLIKP